MTIRRGLYAITDTGLCAKPGLLWAVERAIAGGATMVQYRDKSRDSRRRLAEATALGALCREHQVALIINDDVALSRQCGAAGVHLGVDDTGLRQSRRELGADAIIGVSCYNSLARALKARDQGADYVAFGRFFPSATKPTASGADIPLLREARQRLDIPIVAIGGIDASNGAALVAAGADLLAVVAAVFAATDPMLPATAIRDLYMRSPPVRE